MPPEELTYREGVRADLQQIKMDQQVMMKMVGYTNGKVRKLIIALVLIAGVIIGQSFANTHDIIQLLAGLIH